MRKIILAFLILIVIAEGAYIAYRHTSTAPVTAIATKKPNKSNLAKNSKTKPSVPATTTRPAPPPNTVVVVFDRYGFEPNQFEAPIGTAVLVENKSKAPLTFEPLGGQPNQIESMYLGTIGVGGSSKFVLSSVGSWQFEANNSPSLRGNVKSTPVGQSTVILTNQELPQYDPKTKSLLINYTDYGFLPNITNVPIGTTVTVLNSTDEGGMQFEEMTGDGSPNPALNLGIIEESKSASFVLKTKGTWHYENTWEPSDQGEITAV